MRRRFLLGFGLVLAAAMSAVGLALATNPNERDVKPLQNVQDSDEIFDKNGNFRVDSKIWVLHFTFKDPRLITVDVPGRGRKICLYLWYQVTNNTNQPHTFIPTFELVTSDTRKTFMDEVLPKVQEAVRQVEDSSNQLKIRNSVSIAAEPIPPSQPDAVRKVTGVATWDNFDPDSNRYSIFVTGLSNGWTVTDPTDGGTEPVIRRKTLQLNFKRLGDRYYMDSRDIQFVPPAQWVYRAVNLKPVVSPREEKPAPRTGLGRNLMDPLLPLSPTASR